MAEYLKCTWCGKETDMRDSRPWMTAMHGSCKMEMMEKEGWREATTERDGFWGLIRDKKKDEKT